MNITRHYADGPFGQVHYRRAGQVGQPAVMLLHQTPSHSAMYETLMGELSDAFLVLAPDNPGFGASAAAPRPNNMTQFAASACAVLDAEGIGQCATAFGHHSGAAVAVQLAVDSADRVGSLVLSGPPLVNEAQRQALLDSASDIPVTADGSHLQAMWQRLRGKADGVPLERSQRETLSALQVGDGYGEAYRAVLSQPFGERLDQIQQPVLVMAGDRDVLLGSVEPSAARLANARTAIIEQAATYVCEDDADRVAEAIKRFIRDV